MSDAIKDYANSIYDGTSYTYYTASLSPHLQGIELSKPWQIFSYTVPKIRNGAGFITTIDAIQQSQNFFNDSLSSQNLGNSLSGSQVNLQVPGTLDLIVDHRVEKRDFGSSLLYEDGITFEEKPSIELNPLVKIQTYVSTSQIPLSLRQIGNSPQNFDGVIEPLQIRSVSDRTTSNLINPINSIKGALSLSDAVFLSRESKQFTDVSNLQDTSNEPFLDRINLLNNKLPMPVTSSAPANSFFGFNDTNDIETFYYTGSIDDTFRNGFLSGITLSGTLYKTPNSSFVRTNEVYATRGFIFSQADNYGYDSIAFAGTNRNNRI